MMPMTSPNDPVFFLHHCYVDKVLADWQEIQKINNPEATPHYVPVSTHYVPVSGGPKGHNLKDVLAPFKLTVEETLDNTKLGVVYEKSMKSFDIADFSWQPISPFWAD